MGILSSIFGSKKSINLEDGSWIKYYRECIWKDILSFEKSNGESQTIQVGTDSCYQAGNKVYCICRSLDEESGTVAYYGIILNASSNSEMNIIVDRCEDLNQNVISKDDWTKGRYFSENKFPGIEKAINIIRGNASFNNYSTLPPYVFSLTIGMQNN